MKKRKKKEEKKKGLWIQWHKPSEKYIVIIRLQGTRKMIGYFPRYIDAVIGRNMYLRWKYGSLLEAWRLRRKKRKPILRQIEQELRKQDKEQREVRDLAKDLEDLLG